MPSPFPGMDPFLEGDLWQEFHERMIHQMSAQLLPLVAPKYVALLAKRYVIDRPTLGLFETPERIFYPDVNIAEPRVAATMPAPSGRNVAMAEPAVVIPSYDEVPLLTVEVRDMAERKLVTVIELLSPVNKRGEGFQEYQQRRKELFTTRVHIVEIDLLRCGRRIPLFGAPPPADYYIYQSRGHHRPSTMVWPIRLRERLPAIPIPLTSPDPDVPLDLQAAVDACFALVGYERLLNYKAPLPPPELPSEDSEWVRAVVSTSV